MTPKNKIDRRLVGIPLKHRFGAIFKTKSTAYGESLIYWRIYAEGLIERNGTHAMGSDYPAAVLPTIIAYSMVPSLERAARSAAMPATVSGAMPA